MALKGPRTAFAKEGVREGKQASHPSFLSMPPGQQLLSWDERKEAESLSEGKRTWIGIMGKISSAMVVRERVFVVLCYRDVQLCFVPMRHRMSQSPVTQKCHNTSRSLGLQKRLEPCSSRAEVFLRPIKAVDGLCRPQKGSQMWSEIISCLVWELSWESAFPDCTRIS